MQSKARENLIILRLFPGEEIIQGLRKVCKKYKIKTAVVLSGLGQLAEFELGFFKEKGDYLPERFIEPYELLCLTGNISLQKDGYEFHLHVVLGNSHKQVVGGHFIQGKVSVTAEIVLQKVNLIIKRAQDPKTGLRAMSLE